MAYKVGIPNNGYLPTDAGRVHAPGLEKRMQKQTARVAGGIATGSLSQEELQALKGSSAQYEADLTAAKADNGKVGPRERVALHKELNDVSRQIYDFKHN